MATGVLMPQAGISVESCIITQWLKKPGDSVTEGDILFSYETDKASFECESTASGTLLEIFYGDGDEVPVLTNVCAVGTPDEDVSSLRPGGQAAAEPAPSAAPSPSLIVEAEAPAPAVAPGASKASGVLMPQAGISVESCIITQWLKRPGDSVAVGDILFSYETDKASFECESTASGTLLEIFYDDGDEVPVLVNVCAVGTSGEDVSSLRPGGQAAPAAPAPAPSLIVEATAPAVSTGATGAAGVLMPQAGISVESCIITQWLKKPGDSVAVGDILFSYETDKASFECESTASGTLLEIFYNDGDEVPVLVNVCAVGTPGEDVSSLRPGGQSAPVSAGPAPSAAPAPAISLLVESPAPAVVVDDIKASPRAKKLAEEKCIDLRLASATGPYGRVTEQDVRAAIERGAGATSAAFGAVLGDAPAAHTGTGIGGKVGVSDLEPAAQPVAAAASIPAPAAPAAPAAPVSEAPVTDAPDYEDITFSGVRRAISKSMTASLAAIPQLTHNFSFDASELLAYRAKLKDKAEALGLPNITLNDMILYTVSRLLPEYPDLNAHMLDGNTIRRFKDVHLGIAVDTSRGLLVPVLKNANHKSLAQIAVEAKDLAKQAQEGTLPVDDMSGGTFTISNLGSLGVESFTPVINPPQTGILGVNNIIKRPKEVNGEVRLYPAMTLSVTYDHRAIDGAPLSRFGKELCGMLESFSLLLSI